MLPTISRSFSLPEGVNEEKITAKQKDGILLVEIPKRETSPAKLARAIQIS